MECTPSGAFSGAVCAPKECTATPVANSNFGTGLLSGRVGDHVEVTCSRGYGAQGHEHAFNATCLPTQVWNVQACLDIDECSYPAMQSCGGASHGTCVDVPAPGIGFLCHCNTGYDSNGATCVDTDGCSVPAVQTCDGHGSCQDIPAPSVGFTCQCDRGYAPSSDATTCLSQCAEVLELLPNCMASNLCLVGNGACTTDGNNAECNYDGLPGLRGGDCCASTCVGGVCGATANPFDCLDPAAPLPPGFCNPNINKRKYPACNVTDFCWLGDGFCDVDLTNIPECGFDGGDCCEGSCVSGSYICGQLPYACKDPSYAGAAAAAPTDPPNYYSSADRAGLNAFLFAATLMVCMTR
jgi:hypothetical protein